MSKPIPQRQFFPGQPDAVPPVYVESMTLQEVRCFGEKQTLKFTKPDGSIAQWTVILGENGVGKTTVLQCLAGMAPTLSGEKKTESGEFILGPHFAHSSRFPSLDQWHRSFTKIEDIPLFEEYTPNWTGFAVRLRVKNCNIDEKRQDTLESYYQTGTVFDWGMSFQQWNNLELGIWAALRVYGFGASRRMAVLGRKAFESNEKAESETLFSNESELNNAEEWLLDLDNLASYTEGSNEKRLAYKRLTDVLEMLPKVLPMVHEVEFQVDEKPTKRVRVKFRTDHGWLPIESLSYGYQTMISWIVDFTRRMYDRYPDAKDPLAMPAIVLVDEIDLHLHPKWQRELMGFLSKRFPKTQFIVTAHSPLIIQSEEVANVILLQRDPKKPDQAIVRQDDVAEIRKWRLDQILTSDLYGLESATAPEIKAKEERRSALLRKARRTPKDEAELAAIEEELSKLPAFSSREAVRAEQQFQETTALLAEAEKLVAKPKAKARKK